MQINQHFLLELSERRDITLEIYRVFMYLNARLDFENWFVVPQTEIANHLKMKPQNVNRAIKKMEALGIVLRGPRVDRCYAWRLNPNAGWKGKITHLRRELKETTLSHTMP